MLSEEEMSPDHGNCARSPGGGIISFYDFNAKNLHSAEGGETFRLEIGENTRLKLAVKFGSSVLFKPLCLGSTFDGWCELATAGICTVPDIDGIVCSVAH